MLTGAVSGALFGGVGGYINGMSQAGTALSGLSQVGLHAGAGAISGGINSAITGGNIGQGMLIGGLSGGFGKYAGGFIPEGYGYQLAGRTLIGGVTGGMASVISGGDFGQGFRSGATTAAIGFIANDWLHDKALPWAKNQYNKLTEGRSLFSFKASHINNFKSYNTVTGEQNGVTTTAYGQSFTASIGLQPLPNEISASLSVGLHPFVSAGFSYTTNDYSGTMSSFALDFNFGYGFSPLFFIDFSGEWSK